MPASLGEHGPGLITMWLGFRARISSNVDGIVAADQRGLTQLPHVTGKVVDEGVVVID